MENEDLLILYTRPGCHLCEQVMQMMALASLGWRPINIEDDSRLLEQYGLRIPVLKHPVTGCELFYPFSAEQLEQFAKGQ